MSELFAESKFEMPIDRAAVTADWRRRGYSCHAFVDPPGREWNDFVRNVDEVVTVLDGELELLVGDRRLTLGPGDEAFIPRGVRHSVRNVDAGATRWLFGYN